MRDPLAVDTEAGPRAEGALLRPPWCSLVWLADPVDCSVAGTTRGSAFGPAWWWSERDRRASECSDILHLVSGGAKSLFMFARPIWLSRLAAAHSEAPIVWFSGVRRTGKSTLVRSLPEALVLNCDLPSTAERLRDPEAFFASLTAPLLVFDEVHQLPDPSRLLKIAADAFPQLRVIAAGSSTLAATAKFRDSLAGRKRQVHLTPVLVEELDSFGIPDLERRLLHGGLPQPLLAASPPTEFYAEWVDSFYARDVVELFRVEKRRGFLLLLETVLRNSGGLTEITSLARATALSRPTVSSYLDVLETTHALRILRPFHGGGRQELYHQPKVYAFDTGFVAWAHGWTELHVAERGFLWEHVVLDTLATLPGARVQFWRDKQQREIDFVVPTGRSSVHAFECKWSVDAFDPKALRAFRAAHPHGRNFLVAPIVGAPYDRTWGDLKIRVLHASALRAEWAGAAQGEGPRTIPTEA